VDKTCLGLTDNKGLTKFGLRMNELDVTSPHALTAGIINTTVSMNVWPTDATCNLQGAGTFSWLLQFDTAAGTLKTGGAKPAATPSQGYTFDDETLMQAGQPFHVQPVTYTGITPDAMGNFAVTMGQDLIIPIFLNAAGTSVVLLPLHKARLTTGQLSSNNNCIGTYNVAGLDPSMTCQPMGSDPLFNSAGKLDGYITLEEADTVVVTAAANDTLCVLLSGNATMYSTPVMRNGSTVNACTRDSSGKIMYQGGWCASTNMAAAAGCADADELAANFAASSILINN
jgi:hypothetical protein